MIESELKHKLRIKFNILYVTKILKQLKSDLTPVTPKSLEHATAKYVIHKQEF